MANATLLSGPPRRTTTGHRARLSRRALLTGMPVAALALGTTIVAERRHASPPATPTPVSLVVTSVPVGAAVLVNGTPHGHTPARLALAPGPHTLLLQSPDVLPAAVPVQTAAGRVRHLAVALWRRQPAVLPLRPPFPGSSITGAGFLADGRVALGITLPPGNVHQLWRRDLAGRLAQFGPAHAAGPLAAAPDGRTVAYLAPSANQAAQPGGEQGLTSVWTSHSDGRAAQSRYSLLPDAGAARLSALAWAPDGRHLLLVRSDQVAGATPSQVLWLDLATGTAQRLVELPSAIVPGSFLWSPGGDRVAFLTRANALVSLCMLGISPSTFRYLTDLNANDVKPLPYPSLAWSPDSTQVVYAAPVPVAGHGLGDLLFGHHTANALFRTDATDTQSARLGGAFGSVPTWRPDGSILALVPASSSSGLLWEIVDPATGRVQTPGPVALPSGGVNSVCWDAARQQALLLQQDNGRLAFSLLSFAPEVG